MKTEDIENNTQRPNWLRVKLPTGKEYTRIKEIVEKNKLHTICTSGHCPNIGECWKAGTATFMILGNICTRSCTFCAVKTGRPTEYDTDEPNRVAEAIKLMNIKHAVITSVNRDELKDSGAAIWHETVVQIKKLCPGTTIETLIPDVKSRWQALETIISAGQEIVSHNIETVPRLYKSIRPQALYLRSLEQIARTKDFGKKTKSGIMVGIGETDDEIYQTMEDLVAHGLDIFTIGQYLQPTKYNLPITTFVSPEKFAEYKIEGLKRGLKYVESGPLVRSSYRAEKHLSV